MPLPDDFVPGQVIAAADINAIKDEVALKIDEADATATFVARVLDATGVAATDTALVQDAIDNNKQLGAGTYLCNQITLSTDSRRLRGLGIGITTVKAANGLNSHLIYASIARADLQISDLTIDGNKANQTSGSAINLVQSVRAVIRNVRVIDAEEHGIQLFQGSDATIEGCFIASPGGSGIRTSAVDRVRIANNHIAGAGNCGYENENDSDDLTITGNVINGAGFIGIATSAGARHSITGNTIRDCTDNGIDIGNATDLAVTGNTIYNTLSGICSDSNPQAAPFVTNGTVSGNSVNDTTEHGINIIGPVGAGATGWTITGNTVTNSDKAGIALVNISHSTLSNNVCRNSSTSSSGGYGGLLLAGTCSSNTITGNRCFDDRGTPLAYGVHLSGTHLNNLWLGNSFTGNLGGKFGAFDDSETVEENRGLDFAWTARFGTWATLDDFVYPTATSGDTSVIFPGAADFWFSVEVKPSLGYAGVEFREIDNDNYLLAQLDSSGANVTLFKKDGGAYTSLATAAAAWVANHFADIEIIAVEDKIAVNVNGFRCITHALSGPDQTKYGAAVNIGFRANGINDRFRRIRYSVR